MIARNTQTNGPDRAGYEPGPGVVDRTLRAAVTIGLIWAVITGEGTIGAADLGMMVAAILIGATAATGWDPIYQVFGWSTREADAVARYRAARETRAEAQAFLAAVPSREDRSDAPPGQAENDPDYSRAA